jgi:hypothetical protein
MGTISLLKTLKRDHGLVPEDRRLDPHDRVSFSSSPNAPPSSRTLLWVRLFYDDKRPDGEREIGCCFNAQRRRRGERIFCALTFL